jgi:hypothetical protein
MRAIRCPFPKSNQWLHGNGLLVVSNYSKEKNMIQGFVELPDELKIVITSLILAAVSFVFAKLIALVPFLAFLEQFRQPVAMAVAAALIGWFQNIVPDAYAAVAILGLQLVLAVLALFKVGDVLKERGVKGFK